MPDPDWSHWQARLAPLLRPAGRLYAQAMRCREHAYAAGWLASWRPPAPCVSVGNIGWGGSGKTPLCQYLLRRAAEQGQRAALLTRGYRAHPPHLPYLVRADSPPDEAGDEPLLLAQSCPEAHVWVDPLRTRAGARAWRTSQPDLFLLDDGFQHLAVKRDIDLVLLRPEDLDKQWDTVLPGGSWREGRRGLRRADGFCIQAPPAQWSRLRAKFTDRLGGLQKPLFSFSLTVQGIRHCQTGLLRAAPGTPYLLISGVAGPQRVLRTATDTFGPPVRHLCYPDHHRFTAADWETIQRTARDHACPTVLCTPKDAVKLRSLADDSLFAFDLDLAFGPQWLAAAPFPHWLEHRLVQKV